MLVNVIPYSNYTLINIVRYYIYLFVFVCFSLQPEQKIQIPAAMNKKESRLFR